jgi:hypothetical protein
MVTEDETYCDRSIARTRHWPQPRSPADQLVLRWPAFNVNLSTVDRAEGKTESVLPWNTVDSLLLTGLFWGFYSGIIQGSVLLGCDTALCWPMFQRNGMPSRSRSERSKYILTSANIPTKPWDCHVIFEVLSCHMECESHSLILTYELTKSYQKAVM